MTRLGVVILAHGHLNRVEHVARMWAKGGALVQIHVDARVPEVELQDLVRLTAQWPQVELSARRRCHWGGWSIVAASLDATARLLTRGPDRTHVLLSSGSCLPLRPVSEVNSFLDRRRGVDFIESFRADMLDAGADGLTCERTDLWHPLPWHKFRRGFDLSVAAQRRIGLRRRRPAGLIPHIGSQWWCLTRRTLERILTDPNRSQIERFYRHSWIPDEGYFQTQARRWSTGIAGHGLTYSSFDRQGKPRVFYDDHAEQLRTSGAFIARKIWHGADHLYRVFPSAQGNQRPDISRLDRALEAATPPRRPIQSSLPQTRPPPGQHLHLIYGLEEVCQDFDLWLKHARPGIAGRLFAPGVLHALPSHVSTAQRDADPGGYLRNYLEQNDVSGFRLSAEDLSSFDGALAQSPLITIHMVTGAWLAHRPDPATAAAWQRAELAWCHDLESGSAQVNKITLGALLTEPEGFLRAMAGKLGVPPNAPLPALRPLPGLDVTVQHLRRAGFAPKVFGALPSSTIRLPATLRRTVGE